MTDSGSLIDQFKVPEIFMSDRPDKKPLIYALISILCPVAAVAGTLVFQSIAHSDFWESVTNEENAVAAMMGFAEIIELFLYLGVGSLIGFLIALKSLSLEKRLTGILALIINGLPLFVVAYVWFRASVRGGW